ncbi:nucleotide sugar dehydrogenase [Candidatus Nucleicultrix amoebiphila]|jgi:nucleotide sugar dehydrogenase|uniref:nucleotide sugar dehydrogenase n=1 Tax=Candidatus Nucleicultrix amoebiphila TaxID=1509244 RepID=UPI000A26E968|nr:nucleotide sugar dehydrogenase [Candidatus Nucleicultrix amoebiphila]
MHQQKVCIQGLGFVGSAMATAVALAKDQNNASFFQVVGVDLPSAEGQKRIKALNQGVFPFETLDEGLKRAVQECHQAGNLSATSDESAYEDADIVVIDVPLDFDRSNQNLKFSFLPFEDALKSVADRIKPECLVIIETTVPPGTCEKIVFPIFTKSFLARGLNPNDLLLAHSYERVMPGKDYLDSIINYYRCFSGYNEHSSNACRAFLEKIINTQDWPLTELSNITSSEIAKVLENSYRAVNIAFMEEWAAFAESMDIDLYSIIKSIRMRPTHSNIRQPGFGVGGYCLTKDPLFASIAAKELFGLNEFHFPFCELAIKQNQRMPLRCLDHLTRLLGDLKDHKILLLGVSYRQDVADTRFSPSEIFCKEVLKQSGKVICHDPLVSFWPELGITIESDLNKIDLHDISAVVFALPHQIYANFDFREWLKNHRPLIFDANNVLSSEMMRKLKQDNHKIFAIGKGSLN